MNESFDQQAAHSPSPPDRLAAGRTELRQRHIDGKPEGRTQRAGKPGEAARANVGGEVPVHGMNAIAPARAPQRPWTKKDRMP
jgi:hypothetical protein